MKRFFALLLCAAMLSAFAVPVSAADNSTYPVSGIDDRAYLADEDNSSRVDMSSTVNRVPYGETVYFPLRSNGASDAVSKKNAEIKTTNTELEVANKELERLKGLKQAYTDANNEYEAAKKAAGGDLSSLKAKVVALENEVEAAKKNVAAKQKDYDNAETALNQANADLSKKVDLTELNKAVTDAERKLTDAKTTNASLDAAIKEAQDKMAGLTPTDSGWDTLNALLQQAITNKNNNGFTDAQINGFETAKTNAITARDTQKGINDGYDNAVTTATNKKAAANTALTNAKTTQSNKERELQNARDAISGSSNLEKLEETLSKAKNAWEAESSKLSPQEAKVTNLNSKIKTLEKELKALEDNSFSYVHESSAVEKAKVKVKWEENGNYAGSPSLVRKRVADESYISGVSSGSNYIYFIAVPIKSRSTTDSRDLFGRITLSRTGSDRFEYDLDIAIEIGYKDAEDVGSDEGTITIRKQTFRRNDFDSDSEVTLYFEADSSSKIVFSGRSALPSSIVLGLDTDPDDKLSDKIYKEYGIDVDFFNGNYATFNNTGTLYLAPTDGEDDYYVYSISEKGDIARVSAEWDDSEEAYAVRTRTLGRYFLSPQRLSSSFLSKINGTSSSSSSKPSGSGSTSSNTGTGDLVVIPAPSAPTTTTSTPTYNPPPSSSQSNASSSQPSSSSSSSSEEASEPEDEDEETSEPEDEETSEPEEVVDVDTDADDTDGPKKGGSMLVWILVIVGLIAAGGAVGFVIYNNKVKRDDGYSEYDEYNDDDDFPDDDSRD